MAELWSTSQLIESGTSPLMITTETPKTKPKSPRRFGVLALWLVLAIGFSVLFGPPDAFHDAMQFLFSALSFVLGLFYARAARGGR